MNKKELLDLIEDMIDYVQGHIGTIHSDTDESDEEFLQELVDAKAKIEESE